MRFLKHIFVARPDRAPSSGLPLGVATAGFYRVEPPFESFRKTLDRVQLFWCVAGCGSLMLHNQPRRLKRGEIAILFPGMRHRYFADAGLWSFYWLTLDGPLAGANAAAFGLDASIYPAGKAPINQFRALFDQVPRPARENELRASALAYAILSQAAGSRRPHADEQVEAALDLLHGHWNDPDLTFKTIADRLSVGYTALAARFRAVMGVTPSAYLKRLRIQNALAQLRISDRPIKEIAWRCGYADPNYFARVIRRITGQSPSTLV